jgi:hypothetical protein
MKDRQSRHFTSSLTKDQVKDSGMAVVLIFLIIGWIAKADIWFILATAALLADMIFPMFFYPFAIVWFGISSILGSVVSKVFLVIIYLCIVLPVALLRQSLGKDPLSLKGFKKSTGSVMRSRNYLYRASDMEKPF